MTYAVLAAITCLATMLTGIRRLQLGYGQADINRVLVITGEIGSILFFGLLIPISKF